MKASNFILIFIFLSINYSVKGQLLNVLGKAKSISEQTISGVATPVQKVAVATTLKKCDVFKTIFGASYEKLKGSNNEPDVTKLTLDFYTKFSKIKKVNITQAASKLLELSDFDVNKPLVIFLHGFLESSSGESSTTVSKAVLEDANMNVLALDSSSILSFIYFKASTCVRFIGKQLAEVLAELVNCGMDPKNIHVVGHSLGAHMAGFCGKTFHELTGKKIGHITGLDPAGPCFFQEKTDLKLKESDADFVDVIHSDAGVLGLVDPLGHVDFYPNNGEQQPGCVIPPCSHSRAWEFYTASIKALDRFPAVKCVSWDVFVSGSCDNSEKHFMGFGVDKNARGTYYLKTLDKSPYGLGGPKPEASAKKGIFKIFK